MMKKRKKKEDEFPDTTKLEFAMDEVLASVKEHNRKYREVKKK